MEITKTANWKLEHNIMERQGTGGNDGGKQT